MTTTTGLLPDLLSLHATVYQTGSGSLIPSVVGGLIGGGTVFAGVLFAEYLTRKRERIWRYDDARIDLLTLGADIFIPGLALTREDRDRKSTQFVTQLLRLRSIARPPLPKSKEILAEIDEVFERYNAVSMEYRNDGKTPDYDKIIGLRLGELSQRKRGRWRL